MAKIPRNLSDKDMLKGWQEEESIEQRFLDAEKADERAEMKRRQEEHPSADIRIAYLTKDVIDALGKLLLELKVELYKSGIVDYKMSVRREGNDIILSPAEGGVGKASSGDEKQTRNKRRKF